MHTDCIQKFDIQLYYDSVSQVVVLPEPKPLTSTFSLCNNFRYTHALSIPRKMVIFVSRVLTFIYFLCFGKKGHFLCQIQELYKKCSFVSYLYILNVCNNYLYYTFIVYLGQGSEIKKSPSGEQCSCDVVIDTIHQSKCKHCQAL